MKDIEPSDEVAVQPPDDIAVKPWLKRPSSLIVSGVAVLALAAVVVFSVNAAQARAADAEATEAIAVSVTASQDAIAACEAAIDGSSAQADLETYTGELTAVLGEDSDVVQAAVASFDAPLDKAACAELTVTELSPTADPSDALEATLAANTTVVDAAQVLVDQVADFDALVAEALTSIAGLDEAHAAYVAADETLTKALKSADGLVKGDLGEYLTDDDTKALTAAREAATSSRDAVTEAVVLTEPGALEDSAATLTATTETFNTVVKKVNDSATAAKKKADEAAKKAAAEADAKRKAAAQKKSQSPAKSSKSSSGSSSKPSQSSGSNSSKPSKPSKPSTGSSGGSNEPAPSTKPVAFFGTGCDAYGGRIRYMVSNGWTEASARADAKAQGCKGFF